MKLRSVFSAFKERGDASSLKVIVPLSAAFTVAFAPMARADYGQLPFMSLLNYLVDQFTGTVAVVLGILGFCYVGFCALSGNFARALMSGFGIIIVVSCLFFAPTIIDWVKQSASEGG